MLSRELANLSFSNRGPKAIMPNMNPADTYVVGGGMAARECALCATCDDCEEAATYSCSHERCKEDSGRPFLLCTFHADDHKKRKSTKSHHVVALGAPSSSSMSTDTPQTSQRAGTSEGGSNNAQGRAREALPPSTNTPETALRPRTGEGGSARQGGSAARQLPFNAASENNNNKRLRLCPHPHQEGSSSSTQTLS